jgi:hypothetical protein
LAVVARVYFCLWGLMYDDGAAHLNWRADRVPQTSGANKFATINRNSICFQ